MGASPLERAASALLEARSVVLGSHVEPDGDAIGSLLGLAAALDAVGVPVRVVAPNHRGCPPTYSFLPGCGRFEPASEVGVPDVFVSLDSPVLSRLGEAEHLARGARLLIAIDHHPDAAFDCGICVFDSTAAATGALVWDLLPHLGVMPTADMATCLYTALLSDTGRFSYANTTPTALRAAAAMIEAGADPHAIYVGVYENRSSAAQSVVTRVLGRVTFANGGAVAYSWIDSADLHETGMLPEESENFIDHLRPIGGVDVIFLARIDGDTVRVSLRAKTDVDVGEVARAFGGGGHKPAAGFTYEGGFTALLAALLPMLPGGKK